MTINASGPHPSHELRSGDASTWDVKCINCGYTDHVPGGWGELASPCRKAKSVNARLDEIALKYARRVMNPDDCEEWPEFLQNFRDALDKAIELVLTREPSHEMKCAAINEINETGLDVLPKKEG